ncbi:hypothetical protein SAMD00019534_114610 [Acytostelium subglobosum LB1]|uniref:hypothetical protein n=1 Tax=Acytostelium subglobosum LB1 TaxID=1410327 RepID=UPI000644B057|nr:hypothetical protein SAMD00019534_114610 [Acytostelium subglobosum LB1]GAM28285.1 hypothetical protein SAMD00019534_114610 [Acytostelium subglobosum LB1]|eukprot:XP_012748919.1 hypothetical protein SAMD00019534_114610 [Acytostelium subglobosum LB1]
MCISKIDDLSSCSNLLDGVVDSSSPSYDSLLKEKDDSNVKVVLAGPTQSGKSMLINVLLSMHILPTGTENVTSRICILRNSPTICIKLFRVVTQQDNGTSYLECLDDETITFESSDLNLEPIRMQLRTCLDMHLVWKWTTADSTASFKEWTNKVVMLEFPSPLLETGLEIIDLPGFSPTNNTTISPIYKDFFQAYQPTGIMYCYPNSSRMDGLTDLISSLPTDCTARKSIFIAHTMVSWHEVQTMNNIQPGEGVSLEWIDRHSHQCYLKQDNSTHGGSPQTFALVNSLDFVMQPKTNETRYIFQQFINKLIKWIARLYRTRGDINLSLVEKECNRMATKIQTTQSILTNIEDYSKVIEDSAHTLASIESEISGSLCSVIETIPTLIKQVFATKLMTLINESVSLETVEYIKDEVLHFAINQLEADVASSIGTFPNTILEQGDSIVSILMKYTKKVLEHTMRTPIATLLSKDISSAIYTYLLEGFLTFFTTTPTPAVEHNGAADLMTFVDLYPESINIKKLEMEIEQIVIRKFNIFKCYNILQIKGLETRSPNMLPNLMSTCLERYNALYLDTYILHSRLFYPFDYPLVDKSKVMTEDSTGFYHGTINDKAFFVKMVNSNNEDHDIKRSLAQQVRMMSTTSSLPMALSSVFYQYDALNGQSEWLLLFIQDQGNNDPINNNINNNNNTTKDYNTDHGNTEDNNTDKGNTDIGNTEDNNSVNGNTDDSNTNENNTGSTTANDGSSSTISKEEEQQRCSD